VTNWLRGPMGESWNRWTVRRAPSFKIVNGRTTRRFWLYHNGLRYTPTGRFEDAVSFASATAAKRYAERRPQ
jgi:hypothetical protein